MVLTQKPVLIMNNSMEAPIKAETVPIFTYQPRNFISTENPNKKKRENDINIITNSLIFSKRTKMVSALKFQSYLRSSSCGT